MSFPPHPYLTRSKWCHVHVVGKPRLWGKGTICLAELPAPSLPRVTGEYKKEVLLISPLHAGKFQSVTKPLSMFEAIKVQFFLPWCDNKWALYLCWADQTWPSEDRQIVFIKGLIRTYRQESIYGHIEG